MSALTGLVDLWLPGQTEFYRARGVHPDVRHEGSSGEPQGEPRPSARRRHLADQVLKLLTESGRARSSGSAAQIKPSAVFFCRFANYIRLAERERSARVSGGGPGAVWAAGVV